MLKFNKEIPKQVRDDKKTRAKSSCHAELVSASGLFFSDSSRRTFHPGPQDGALDAALINGSHPEWQKVVSARSVATWQSYEIASLRSQ
jgi:hypothetical protein